MTGEQPQVQTHWGLNEGELPEPFSVSAAEALWAEEVARLHAAMGTPHILEMQAGARRETLNDGWVGR